MTRRFPRRRLDMPDPRGLFLGPILRGEHVSAIYLHLRATWGALEPQPDPHLRRRPGGAMRTHSGRQLGYA